MGPKFIAKVPHDVIDGQPIRYHRTAADQFLLYSVGWNQIDDHKKRAQQTDLYNPFELNPDDLVWTY